MTVSISKLETFGDIAVEGKPYRLQNNVWLVGDSQEVIVIDPAHDEQAVAAAVGGRRVTHILLTHGHADHVSQAREFARLVDAETWLHEADLELWHGSHPGTTPDHFVTEGERFSIAGVTLVTTHTPGHTPGSVCFVAEELGTVFTGDTLFEGGPGATRWPYSSFEQIIESITDKLFVLPGDTVVRTGHGPETTIATERSALVDWVARGF